MERFGARRWFWLIFAAAAFPRLVYVVKVDPPPARLFKFEVTSAARNFAATGEIANPYLEPTGPTAHLAPAFPAFIGLILRYTGEPLWGWVLKPLASLVSATCWALMPWLAARFGLPPLAGILAGLCGGLLPFQLYVETNGVWETCYGVLAQMLLLAWTARLWERDEGRAGPWFRLGIVWGASMLLVATQLVVFAGVVTLSSLWLVRGRGRRWLTLQAVCMGGACLALVPWTVRNYIVLGGFVPIRSNGGLELALSFRDGVGAVVDFKTQNKHPNNSSEESLRMRQMGELAYMRMRAEEAKAWMAAHPGSVVSLTLRRVVTFWFMPYPDWPKKLTLWAFTVFGLGGFIAAFRSHRRAALLTGSVLVPYPIAYYLHVLDPRYVYPVYWVLILLTCTLIAQHAGRWRARDAG